MTGLQSRPRTAPTAAVQPIPVVVPAYDLSALTPAVVHFGVGGFHRAHQAVYFDDLAAQGVHNWGVIGVGIRRPLLRNVLSEQGNLFTVVERSGDRSQARVIGVLTDCLLLTTERARVLGALTDPRIRLATLTITGDGYAASDGGNPVFELLVEALDERRLAGLAPFTVLSCDNLPDAGAAARAVTLELAQQRGSELAAWIADRVTFPASMVDRITPSTSDAEQASIATEFGVRDRSPVITEPFAQWIIEDSFCNGRPPLDQVGVRFVDDVRPYKLIKSRLLNGGHCALGYLGLLAGHETTSDAMADEAIDRFMRRLLADEIAPLLPADIPGMELTGYQQKLLERLGNAAIGDPLSRLCRRGSTKMPSYLLPSLLDARAAGRDRRLLNGVVAAWVTYLQGRDPAGHRIEVLDSRASELRPLAERAWHDPRPLLSHEIFGDLRADDCLVRELPALLDTLAQGGVAAMIAQLLAEQPHAA